MSKTYTIDTKHVDIDPESNTVRFFQRDILSTFNILKDEFLLSIGLKNKINLYTSSIFDDTEWNVYKVDIQSGTYYYNIDYVHVYLSFPSLVNILYEGVMHMTDEGRYNINVKSHSLEGL
jgi:hypothetical protein